jgi:hypothetical protein
MFILSRAVPVGTGSFFVKKLQETDNKSIPVTNKNLFIEQFNENQLKQKGESIFQYPRRVAGNITCL